MVAYRIADGELHVFRAPAVMFATGGFGRMFRVTSNAFALTGDGVALAYRRGVPMEDMEFYQFHPTGIVGIGILLSEAARGEGGILRNNAGERFMERYAPTLLDLAPRDMVSRAIYMEIREGRGIDGKDYVHLDLTHLGKKVIDEKLPDITEFARVYQGIEPITQPVPIQPTAHYAMGGIPTNVESRVVADEKNTVVPGLYAAGECACVSVHGANRLGTNSLIDILVFGRRAGVSIAAGPRRGAWRCRTCRPTPPSRCAPRSRACARGRAARTPHKIRRRAGRRDDGQVRRVPDRRGAERADARDPRAEGALRDGRASATRAASSTRTCSRRGRWATCSTVPRRPLAAALARTEIARRALREDYPERDDTDWLKHSLAYKAEGGPDLRYKPVTITKFEPKPRTY